MVVGRPQVGPENGFYRFSLTTTTVVFPPTTLEGVVLGWKTSSPSRKEKFMERKKLPSEIILPRGIPPIYLDCLFAHRGNEVPFR